MDGALFVVSATHRKRQMGLSSWCPLLLVMSRNTAQAGWLRSPFPIHLSHLQLLHSSHWFQEINKSALGFITHGEAHMVKPSDGGGLYWKSGVAHVLDRYFLIKPASFLGGFKFPYSNWHENIEKYVCSFPTWHKQCYLSNYHSDEHYPKTPPFDIQNAQRLAVSSPSWLLLPPFAYTTWFNLFAYLLFVGCCSSE